MIRVLVAEDQSAVRAGLVLILGSAPDIEVVGEAADGEEAVALARELRPDLVLMDVQMPLMDGYMATRMIRDWEQKANISPIPIIALTAHAYEEEKQKSIAAGCSDHLTKPLKKSTLLNAIQNWIAAGSPETSAVDECHTPPSR